MTAPDDDLAGAAPAVAGAVAVGVAFGALGVAAGLDGHRATAVVSMLLGVGVVQTTLLSPRVAAVVKTVVSGPAVAVRRRRARPPRARGHRGWERLARVVVAVLVVGAGLYGVNRVVGRATAPEVVAGVKGMNPADAAALDNQADVERTGVEMGEITSDDPYTPFTGSSLLDYDGEFVNVRNRVRRSYQPPIPDGTDPVDVWFFGASTMFGFAMQRDQHTIPSEFAREAEAAGIPVRVRNYGTTGVTNYSETVLLSLLLTGGERPDVVVFYDGLNDISLQLLNHFGAASPPGEPGELGAFRTRDVLAASKGARSEPPSRVVPRDEPARPEAQRFVSDIVGTYGQGVELSRALAQFYGFDVMHFWQPDIFTKQPLDPGETPLLEPLALDRFRFESMVALSKRVRAQLPDGVEDISAALNTTKGPVLTDIVHTNEVGAAAVARSMFDIARPRLEA